MRDRRSFLKIAALSAAGLAAGAALPRSGQAAASYGHAANALSAKRWAMVIDMRKLDDPARIQAMIRACHTEHNVPDVPEPKNVKWIWTDSFEHVFPDEMNEHLPESFTKRQFLLLCNHCTNPPCTRVCPTKATYSRPDGIVAMDYHRCIGCRFCMAGCPYGARSFNFFEPRPHIKEPNPKFPERMRGVVEKCTFCSERLEAGRLPACVEASGGALLFGDLEDPASPVCQALNANYSIRRKPSLGTQPGVYYIV